MCVYESPRAITASLSDVTCDANETESMFYISSSPDQKKEAECNAYMTDCRKYRLNVPCKLGNLLVIGLIIPYEKGIVHPKI